VNLKKEIPVKVPGSSRRISVTRLRVSKAIGLDHKDVDLNEAVLSIRRGKNRKCRLVPISPCAAERLRVYRAERNWILGTGRVAFFLLETGERPGDCCVQYNFALVCQRIGLRSASANMAAALAATICATPSRCAQPWTGIAATSIRTARCSSSAPI
jgi:hypothetical protein